MLHLTILLTICFIVQTVGYFYLRNNIVKKTNTMDIEEIKRIAKKSANYIILGLVIQLIVIISQVIVYFLFVKNIS